MNSISGNYEIIALGTNNNLFPFNSSNFRTASTVHQIRCLTNGEITIYPMKGSSFVWNATSGLTINVLTSAATVSSGSFIAYRANFERNPFYVDEPSRTIDPITPPITAATQYLYSVYIRGDGYDPVNDTYNSITIDGVNYSSTGGALSSLVGINPNNAFDAIGNDLASANFLDSNNDYNYLGYGSDLIANDYILTIVSNSPHTIILNVTLNGSNSAITLNGGAFTIVDKCITVNTESLSGYYINFEMYNEVGTISDYILNSGLPLQNNVNNLNNINSFLNTQIFLIPFNTEYTDNGNGTYTFRLSGPDINTNPRNLVNFDLGFNNFSSC